MAGDEESNTAKSSHEPSARVRAIAEMTVEKLNAHFEKRGGLNTCEACGSDNWTITTDPNGKPTRIQSQLFLPANNALLFFPIFCGSCGNTRFINAAQVADNVEANYE